MLSFYTDRQTGHAPAAELNRGILAAPFEAVSRTSSVVRALVEAGFVPPEEPTSFPDDAIARIHDPHFLDFLRTAHKRWRDLGREGDALPMCWPGTTMFPARAGASLDAQLGQYCFDVMTPITGGSWSAARASADSALAGASALANGERSAFALCRPPGHHAGSAAYGGYCFLNNAAIATQYLRDRGAARVAILDPDYHHGNGTQEIFYTRDDVTYASIHADPLTDFPFFSGFADETGTGAGEGYNLNIPLPNGTAWPIWSAALEQALAAVERHRADALVVSLGVDTFEGDPLCRFRLRTDDFARLGARIAALGLPTLFVLEGGYQLEHIGHNVVATLSGFLDR